ncbi:MAG: choice-of-anchor A family protein [Oscillospiraceae bacterium]|nr:choice-of-anchor A family protein [Oscillospiraceae bacterium]
MKTADRSRKVLQSVSAFAFALSMFATNAGSASAESEDQGDMAGAMGISIIKTADDEEEVSPDEVNDDDNGDGTNGITTGYEFDIQGDSFLGDAADHNLFALNDVTLTAGRTFGSIAVGGALSIPDGYTARSAVAGSIASGSVESGCLLPSDTGLSFDDAFEELRYTSTVLASVAPNGTVSNGSWGGEIVFRGTDPGLNVFELTTEQLTELRKSGHGILCIRFDVPETSVSAVNITGGGSADIAVNAGAFYAGSFVSSHSELSSKMIFNVTEAESVIIGSSMGSVLAPVSDVRIAQITSNPHFEGQLICRSYTGANEFGKTAFVPNDAFNRAVYTAAYNMLTASDLAEAMGISDESITEDDAKPEEIILEPRMAEEVVSDDNSFAEDDVQPGEAADETAEDEQVDVSSDDVSDDTPDISPVVTETPDEIILEEITPVSVISEATTETKTSEDISAEVPDIDETLEFLQLEEITPDAVRTAGAEVSEDTPDTGINIAEALEDLQLEELFPEPIPSDEDTSDTEDEEQVTAEAAPDDDNAADSASASEDEETDEPYIAAVLSGESYMFDPADPSDIDFGRAYTDFEITTDDISDGAAAEKVVVAARRLYRMNKYTG